MSDPPAAVPLSIIVLAYNEEENVAAVLGELGHHLDRVHPGAEIIFVDDGSSDQTAKEAALALEGRAHIVVSRKKNGGMGAGIKTGVRVARGEFVTFLPADGQVPPEAVTTLWDARLQADVVLSVYDHRDDGLHRTLFSAGVRGLIRVVHQVRLRSDGPYLFRREVFDPDQLKPDTFFLNFEFPIRVLRAGLRVKTVTITCRPRRAGVSKTAALGKIRAVFVDLMQMRVRQDRAALSRAIGRAPRD